MQLNFESDLKIHSVTSFEYKNYFAHSANKAINSRSSNDFSTFK